MKLYIAVDKRGDVLGSPAGGPHGAQLAFTSVEVGKKYVNLTEDSPVDTFSFPEMSLEIAGIVREMGLDTTHVITGIVDDERGLWAEGDVWKTVDLWNELGTISNFDGQHRWKLN